MRIHTLTRLACIRKEIIIAKRYKLALRSLVDRLAMLVE